LNILIANTHSCLNTGDSAIVQATIDFLKECFPNAGLSLTSRTHRLDRDFFSDQDIKLYPPLLPAPSIYSGRAGKFWYFLKDLLSIRPKLQLLRNISQCDLVIANGGGYFWTNRKIFPGPMFWQNYWHLKLAVRKNKPIILFPQSFGPLFNRPAASLLASLLRSQNIKTIYVRERLSQELLFSLVKTPAVLEKITICPDMAFLLKTQMSPTVKARPTEMERPLIALTLRDWDFPGAVSRQDKKAKQEKYLQTLEQFCLSMHHQRKASFLILPHARGPGVFENDRIISYKIYSRLSKTLAAKYLIYQDLPDKTPPQSIIELLSQADFVIATRFHSAIFAFLSGTPAISIMYQPKSAGIMQQLGLEHYCLKIEHLETAKLLALSQEVLAQRDRIASMITEKIIEQRAILRTKLRQDLKNTGS